MTPPSLPRDPKSNPHPPRAVRHPHGSDWWLMFRKFLTQGRQVASFAPSSRFMARCILNGIDFDRAKCIVELGAGTGPITAELVKHVRPDTKLMVVELDKDMAARLAAKFPTVDVVNGDARDVEQLLAARGLTQVDHVVSGLPLPSFPPAVRDDILATSARLLGPDGSFRQLTVMPWVYYKLYRGYFDDVRFRMVPLNLPPGGVYVCRGYRKG